MQPRPLILQKEVRLQSPRMKSCLLHLWALNTQRAVNTAQSRFTRWKSFGELLLEGKEGKYANDMNKF